jgi:CRISPR-associated protein Csx10
MTALPFTLTIEMQSDWHIGIGAGRHRSIDRLVDRDEDGLPFLPASTLRGIWRDSAQLLASALDQPSTHPMQPPTAGPTWLALVDQLFGSEPALPGPATAPAQAPVASRIELFDARFPDSMLAQLFGETPGRRALREALTIVKPGISIDRRSGRTKEKFLRFEEVACGGVRLMASGQLECLSPHWETAQAFLIGAAALIDRLGGKRRRGMGKCKVNVDFRRSGPADATTAAGILEKCIEPPVLGIHRIAEPRSFGSSQLANAEWVKLDLKIKLNSPVIVPDEVQGNVVTSLGFIPGTFLLAAIAPRLEAMGVANAWNLVSAGDVRVTPATPQVDGQRGLPVPLFWERPKLKTQGTQLRQIPREQSDNGGVQHTPIRDGFISTTSPMSLQSTVAKVMRTHNTVLDATQRPEEEVGGVYTYEALASGQVYRAEVWIRGVDVGAAAIAATLTCEARLGRARQAGYGRVSISATEQAGTGSERSAADPTKITLWLTSDVLVAPDLASGTGSAMVIAQAVAQTLCCKEMPTVSWSNVRWRRIDSWQAQWGLPRPTLLAVQAGSVIELTLPRPWTEAEIATIEREGIGERPGEGYGAVLVDHRLLGSIAPDYKAMKPMVLTRQYSLMPPNPGEAALLEQLHRRAWARWISTQAELIVGDPAQRKLDLKWENDKPTMSQLGGLRAAMGEFTNQTDVQSVLAWLASVERGGSRSEKWPKGSLGTIKGLLTKPETIWPFLGLAPNGDASSAISVPPPITCGNFDALEDESLQRLALRSLLLHAMRFHKRAKELSDQKVEGVAA